MFSTWGFLKYGYPPFSSIYGWFFHKINQPFGVSLYGNPHILVSYYMNPSKERIWTMGILVTSVNARNFHIPGTTWLVVYLPLWKIWVRQLGWWNSQYINGNFRILNWRLCTIHPFRTPFPCASATLRTLRGLALGWSMRLGTCGNAKLWRGAWVMRITRGYNMGLICIYIIYIYTGKYVYIYIYVYIYMYVCMYVMLCY